MRVKRRTWVIAYSLILLAFTGYLAVDTFAISRVYTVVDTKEQDTSDTSSSDSIVSTDTEYKDENITITLTEYREYDTSIYVADVQVSSPEYLKTALAQSAYGRNGTIVSCAQSSTKKTRVYTKNEAWDNEHWSGWLEVGEKNMRQSSATLGTFGALALGTWYGYEVQ